MCEYGTQVQGEIVLLHCSKGYIVVWTQIGDCSVDEVVRDEVFKSNRGAKFS